MFYYKFNEVDDGSNRYTFIVDTNDKTEERIYHTKSGKDCVVSTEYEVDLETQPTNINLTKISLEQFKKLRENTLEWRGEWKYLKSQRDEEMSKKTTKIREYTIDIDETAMNRIQRGITLANAQFNILLAKGKTPQEACEVYKEKIIWKTSDNKFHEFTISEAIEALHNGILIQSEVWKKYG